LTPSEQNSVKPSLIVILLILAPWVGWCQTTFIGGSGSNWENSANWQSGDIGDVLMDNVTLNTGLSALINNGSNYTIGNLAFANGASLSINSTGALNVGQSGTPKNLTANNTATINISGTLIIWGNVTVNTQLTFNITGTVVIHGNIVMNDGARMFATGNLTVDGNFTGGDDTDVSILGSGLITVGGSVTVGNESQLTGPNGSFITAGCAQGSTNSTFCNSLTLPITLLFFKGVQSSEGIFLNWATASELNFDHFVIEHSLDGTNFRTIHSVSGNGTSNNRHDYLTTHENPFIGTNYYRLKSEDFDGFTEYFPIISVDFKGEKELTVYPNPSEGSSINLDINFSPAENSVLSIYDNMGFELSRQVISNTKTTLIFPDQLSPGVYIARVKSNEFTSTSKFLVK
jgi:hypothetical protein